LRIAEQLIPHLDRVDEIAFTFGSLAPDSGIPNEDWTQFDPPKSVTHFLIKGQGEADIHDLEFYRGYLQNVNVENDPQMYSFRLGYFYHLLSDRVFSLRIGKLTKSLFKELLAEKGLDWENEVKHDWYGLDHRYVNETRDSLFWRIFFPTPNIPSYVPFVPEVAMHQQWDYIREFYSESNDYWLEDRPYPYLNAATMKRHVEDTAAALLKIDARMKEGDVQVEGQTILALLNEDELAPYTPPLGDS
jgi:hypothetical protein